MRLCGRHRRAAPSRVRGRCDGRRAEELSKLDGAMPRMAARDHFARRDIQRGEQQRGAISRVVVGAPFGLAGP